MTVIRIFSFDHRIRCSFALAVWFTVASMLSAQVDLQRFFPPVVEGGLPTPLKAEGKFPQWPVKIQCDVPEVALTCGEKAGEFSVATPAGFRGLAWIRVLDDQSASSLVPILIEVGKVTTEIEPNETTTKATVVECPATVTGKLEKNGDVDMWKVVLKAGEQFVASVTAHSLIASPMDAVLQLVDARGFVIAQAEDSRGLDPQLNFVAKSDGEYFLRIFCFPEVPTGTIGFAGGANFHYVIQLTKTGFLDHVLPLRKLASGDQKPIPFGWNLPTEAAFEMRAGTGVSPTSVFLPTCQGWQWLPYSEMPNGSYATDELSLADQVFDLPLMFCGHILRPNEVDRLRVRVRAGISYRAEVVSREFGFKLDSVIRVLKPDLKTPVAYNDDSGKGNYDAAVEFKAPEDGEVILEVSDLTGSGGLRHAYELQVAAAEPTVALGVNADHFRLGIGKSLEVPITIERKSGYSQRLEFSAKGLPNGVAFETIYSEPKGDSAKSVKLKLNAAADTLVFQGPVEWIATPVDDEKKPLGPPLPVLHALRPQVLLDKVWLTVAAEK